MADNDLIEDGERERARVPVQVFVIRDEGRAGRVFQ